MRCSLVFTLWNYCLFPHEIALIWPFLVVRLICKWKTRHISEWKKCVDEMNGKNKFVDEIKTKGGETIVKKLNYAMQVRQTLIEIGANL